MDVTRACTGRRYTYKSDVEIEFQPQTAVGLMIQEISPGFVQDKELADGEAHGHWQTDKPSAQGNESDGKTYSSITLATKWDWIVLLSVSLVAA